MSPRVALADDHNLVRAGIRALLDAIPGVEVVGEAANGEAALAIARDRQPDILLMDIAMPGLNGLEATRRVCAECPAVRVVILSMHVTGDYVEQALRAGASGYLLKDAATEELALALAAVGRGDTWISPAVSEQVIDRLRGDARPADEALTPRQTEILRLLAEGRSTKEIAYELGLSAKTVETHRAQIMDRLGIRDLAGLVRHAIRVGLVSDN
jgi:DNA-binding NarL/FixJ family response regulator